MTEDKTVAILSYVTLIGFIIAVILHSSKKTRLGAFHLRQSLGLWITAIACWVVCSIIPVIGWIAIPFVTLGVLILAVIGLIAAANGQLKPVPLLGDKYEKWFAGAFN